jgi:hypothetical protein
VASINWTAEAQRWLKDIYDYIAAKGKLFGIPPSPFSPLGQAAKKNGPSPLNAGRLARVGGLGNGGGKMQTAYMQGRGFLNQNG